MVDVPQNCPSPSRVPRTPHFVYKDASCVQFGVDADRVAAATRMLQSLARRGQPTNNVAMILDDGFQHRRIHRDLEVKDTESACFPVGRTGILTLPLPQPLLVPEPCDCLQVVMVNAVDGWGSGFAAPRGPLREPAAAAVARADVVVLHHAPLVAPRRRDTLLRQLLSWAPPSALVATSAMAVESLAAVRVRTRPCVRPRFELWLFEPTGVVR